MITNKLVTSNTHYADHSQYTKNNSPKYQLTSSLNNGFFSSMTNKVFQGQEQMNLAYFGNDISFVATTTATQKIHKATKTPRKAFAIRAIFFS